MEKKFKALGHEVRLKIYRILREEKLCVCEISELLEMSQPAISQHLSQLKQANLIMSDRHGQWTFYSAVDNSFRKTIESLFDQTPQDLQNEIDEIKTKDMCELRDTNGNINQ